MLKSSIYPNGSNLIAVTLLFQSLFDVRSNITSTVSPSLIIAGTIYVPAINLSAAQFELAEVVK